MAQLINFAIYEMKWVAAAARSRVVFSEWVE